MKLNGISSLDESVESSFNESRKKEDGMMESIKRHVYQLSNEYQKCESENSSTINKTLKKILLLKNIISELQN